VKKLFFISFCLLLFLGVIAMVLHMLYFPHWDQRRFIRQLERAGYDVHITTLDEPNLPFAEHIPREYRTVPDDLSITEHADLALLSKIGTNPHISGLYIGRNLRVEELRLLQYLRLSLLYFDSAQDPEPVFASGLDLSGEVGLSADENPISPEWLESWLSSGHLDNLHLVRNEKFRPLLPLILNIRALDIDGIRLTKADLKGLHGRYEHIWLTNTGTEPSWIPKGCSGKMISLRGKDIKPMDLDPLIGRFDFIYADTSVNDKETIKDYARRGVRLFPFRPAEDQDPNAD